MHGSTGTAAASASHATDLPESAGQANEWTIDLSGALAAPAPAAAVLAPAGAPAAAAHAAAGAPAPAVGTASRRRLLQVHPSALCI